MRRKDAKMVKIKKSAALAVALSLLLTGCGKQPVQQTTEDLQKRAEEAAKAVVNEEDDFISGMLDILEDRIKSTEDTTSEPSQDNDIAETDQNGQDTDIPAEFVTIAGEKYDINITELELSGLNLKNEDIAEVSKLLKLEILDLSNNLISDISALSSLNNLKKLYLQNNQITDISVLANLTQLKELNLEVNNITDISPLAGLSQLEVLYINNGGINYRSYRRNKITDISPLANLTQLKKLNLGYNETNISPLANLTKLEELDLRVCGITDITPLANLSQLKKLYISRNDITNISPLASLTQLEELDLENNAITDISPLANLTQLSCVATQRIL